MLRRAVAYSSDNFTYRLALATMSRNLGMFGEASDEYEKLVKDYPGKPELTITWRMRLRRKVKSGRRSMLMTPSNRP